MTRADSFGGRWLLRDVSARRILVIGLVVAPQLAAHLFELQEVCFFSQTLQAMSLLGDGDRVFQVFLLKRQDLLLLFHGLNLLQLLQPLLLELFLNAHLGKARARGDADVRCVP